MVKLTQMRPRIGRLPPRLGPAPGDEKDRNKHRSQAEPWRKLYQCVAWKRLRLSIFKRDLFTCQMCGEIEGNTSKLVCDHIKPHKGDNALFFEPANLQCLCKVCHDSVKQSIERSDKVAAIHPNWLLPSIIPLTIVCGPPVSGKTTYVERHKRPDDLVIDLDVIASEISGEPLHGWDRIRWLNPALYRRNSILGTLSRPSRHRAAWFIVSEPKARHRDWWDRTLKPKNIFVLETSATECRRRAAQDYGRDIRRTDTSVANWWAEYERRAADIIITGERL